MAILNAYFQLKLVDKQDHFFLSPLIDCPTVHYQVFIFYLLNLIYTCDVISLRQPHKPKLCTVPEKVFSEYSEHA